MITTLTIVQGNLLTITCLLSFLQDRYFRIYNSTFFKQKENVRKYIAPLFYFSYGHSGKHLVIFAWECLEKFHLKIKKKRRINGKGIRSRKSEKGMYILSTGKKWRKLVPRIASASLWMECNLSFTEWVDAKKCLKKWHRVSPTPIRSYPQV